MFQTEGFVYDPAVHLYTVDKERKLHVTKVLQIEGCYRGERYFTEGKRTIGDYVHQATAMYDRGELDEENLDEALRGYLQSWLKFLEFGFIPEVIELPLYSRTFNYAGTLDRIGHFRRQPAVRILLDIKTGAPQPGDELQTAAYELLSVENGMPPCDKRGTVHLRPDGKLPKWQAHTEYSDRDAFLCVLGAVQFKQRKGLIAA